MPIDADPLLDARPSGGGSVSAAAHVTALAQGHYENFPVLTRLVPAELREDFAAVYAYCRTCDDLGDETGVGPEARARSLVLLGEWRKMLEACVAHAASGANGSGATGSGATGCSQPVLSESGNVRSDTGCEQPVARGTDTGCKQPVAQVPTHPVFVALSKTIRKHELPAEPFHHLIDAFEQDQRVTRYETWEQVLDYCTRSADPVGRIILRLAGCRPGDADWDEMVAMSDATCTALQLTNFWQDVRRDLLERDRVYLPSAETGIGEDDLRGWLDERDAAGGGKPENRVRYIRAVRGLVGRTWALFERGRALPARLGGKMGRVVWLFGAGGEHVLRAVERDGCTTLWRRPVLSKPSKALLVLRASFMSFGAARRGGGA